jgi:sulfite reductase (ferredoxin)
MNRGTAIPLPSPEELQTEIDRFETAAKKFLAGEIDPDVFKRFRLKQGIYGQRQPGVQMVRIKIPFGDIDSAQLRAIAHVSEIHATGISHLTTRQDIQLHFVKLEQTPALLRALAAVGLTTREACGNTVRNVTACPMAGVCRDELFDVTPYALATSGFFLRHPITEDLPRKFKIAFSGCAHDCAMTAIHDIGVTAASNGAPGSETLGFRVTVGGGLGPSPKRPYLLEEWIPPTELLPLCEAVLRVFSRFGNRKNRSLARLKFVLEKIGFETFYRLYREELQIVNSSRPTALPDALRTIAKQSNLAPLPLLPLTTGRSNGSRHTVSSGNGRTTIESTADHRDWSAWRAQNVLPQRQPGLYAVQVRLILGDIAGPALRAFADIADRFAQGRSRITIQQNFLLRDVQESALPALHAALAGHDLARPGAERIGDVVACPGTASCGLGITASKGLGRAITERLERDDQSADDLRSISIKVSGCPNSCAQHHIATIGFHGIAHKIGGRLLPAYQLHLGGRITGQGVQFGQVFGLKFPAKRVPEVIQQLITLYRAGRRPEESFLDYVDRTGKSALQQALTPFTTPSGESTDDGLFHDWDDDGDYSMDEIGAGECASPAMNFVAQHFDDSAYELAHAHVLLEKSKPFDAVTRADLALVAAARALLVIEEIEPISANDAVKEFEARFIATGRLPAEVWAAVSAARAQPAGTPDAARNHVATVRRLIEACRHFYEQTTGAPLMAPPAAVSQESPAD